MKRNARVILIVAGLENERCPNLGVVRWQIDISLGFLLHRQFHGESQISIDVQRIDRREFFNFFSIIFFAEDQDTFIYRFRSETYCWYWFVNVYLPKHSIELKKSFEIIEKKIWTWYFLLFDSRVIPRAPSVMLWTFGVAEKSSR